MAQVILSPRAVRDLKDISKYLSKYNSISQVRDVLRKISSNLQANAKYPLLGRSRNELFEGLRSFTVMAYTVFYFPLEDGINVARIVYSSRDHTNLDLN